MEFLLDLRLARLLAPMGMQHWTTGPFRCSLYTPKENVLSSLSRELKKQDRTVFPRLLAICVHEEEQDCVAYGDLDRSHGREKIAAIAEQQHPGGTPASINCDENACKTFFARHPRVLVRYRAQQ